MPFKHLPYLLFVLLAFTRCVNDEPTPPLTPPSATEKELANITDILKAQSDLEGFLHILGKVNLQKSTSAPLTLFAIRNVGDDGTSCNAGRLSTVSIKRHIVEGCYSPQDLLQLHMLTCINGEQLEVKQVGDLILLNNMPLEEPIVVGSSIVYFLPCMLPSHTVSQYDEIRIHVNPHSNGKADRSDAALTVKIAVEASGDWEVDWGDGQKGTYRASVATHTYADSLQHTVLINGKSITNLQLSDGSLYEKQGRTVSQNNISLLDITGAKNLEALRCSYNPLLTELDVSHNLLLRKLECEDVGVKHFDLKRHARLQVVNVAIFRDSEEGSLQLGKHPLLESLRCQRRGLQTLALSDFPKLSELDCSHNYLSKLDVSHCPRLLTLGCTDNQLNAISIDNPLLQTVDCSNNRLVSIDVSSSSDRLSKLVTSNNRLFTRALNSLFGSLRKIRQNDVSIVVIGNNPGCSSCNPAIATNKGWQVSM